VADAPEALSVEFQNAAVVEGGLASVQMTLPAEEEDIEFSWSLSSPSDVDTATGTITLPAGDTGITIDIQTTDDTDCEADEEHTLTLTDPNGFEYTASVQIQDNDEPIITIANGSGPEGGTVDLTVSLDQICESIIDGGN